MPQESRHRQENRSAIELKVEYQRLNSFFYDYRKNISRGGTFISTGRPLDIGTMFLFKLFIPTLPEPLVLRGEVRWIRRETDLTADPPEAGMGIRFVLDEDERAAVEWVFQRLMVTSLGQLTYAQLSAEG